MLEFGCARLGAALRGAGDELVDKTGTNEEEEERELGDALGDEDGANEGVRGTTFTLPPSPLPTIKINPASAA